MPQRTNPVSRDDLERLAAAVSRNPGDPAFVELGEAYLSLGRPRDAVDVGESGLRADPQNADGRVMLGRAFCSLHKWKEAQGELLKVVKTNKQHHHAFRLLGEVLMRRGDYERALPVLQHAQNLAPADPKVLALLKRARGGQPLDPPPPVPESTRGRSSSRRPKKPSSSPFDDTPTRVADDAEVSSALGRMELDQREVRGDYRAPQEAGVRRSDGRGEDREAERPVSMHRPPPPENPFAPVGASRMPLPAKDTSQQPAIVDEIDSKPPPPSGRPAPGPPDGVRPRVFSGQKPRGEGEAALRQSAAVGEHYLNNLLTAGLLDVPNVRARDGHRKVPSGAAWGRSTRSAFVGLFAMLGLLTVGGTGWYFYDQMRTAADVEKHVGVAQDALLPGTYQGLEDAVKEAKRAIERNKEDPYSIAVYGQVAAVHHLLYGVGSAGQIRSPVGAISKKIGKGEPGTYEVLVARSALALSDISERDQPEVELRQLRVELAAALDERFDDRTLHWLAGLAALRAGEREQASDSFAKAAAGGLEGLAAARVAEADLLLDKGELAEAFEAYDGVLQDVADHPWAFVGRSLSRSLRKIDPDEAIGDLNVGLAKTGGPRLRAWKQLANAYAMMAIEDFAEASQSLAKADGLDDPRFLARKALAHLELGDFKKGTEARASIEWYGPEKNRDPDPLVTLVDAELYLARGLPRAALSKLEGVSGVRAARARGLALLDLGEAEEAQDAFEDGLELAPDDIELQAWRAAALFIDDKRERKSAEETLAKLGRKSNSKVPPFIHGRALYAAGQTRAAREKLERSLEDVDKEHPNRYAFRAHVLLANIALEDGERRDARKHITAALEQNAGYLPAKGVAGRMFLAADEPRDALEQLGDVVASDVASASEELAWVEATARVFDGKLSAEDRTAAEQALERAEQKGASDSAIRRATELLEGKDSSDDDDVDDDFEEDRGSSSSSRRKRRRSSRRRR